MSKERSSWECWHCGKSPGIGGAVELAGSYQTVLCQACRNAFHEYIIDHPTFRACEDAGASITLLLARTAGDGIDRTDDIWGLREQLRQLRRELYALACAWVHSADNS